ncbi:hypothetical protein TraAM80_06599 [Trypanosoma rangeli]|uniref:cDENN domain-containing protein n=1 Tax=Trypanosoma rangeli TaxID=5698 RepID=A0A422N9T8_TRYRA|nr:uncharacterized protein TraAM80_06599 [Trypanosoma rangeli]RNF02186.1 hypothetical protein TraAM80_06599 [Trypanosoma rangeli]|eukprot:RNF02186.1 hypothetical protein TraAM80_06599 [Trypanosoma rangeli]
MQPSALVQTVALHRVWLPPAGGSDDGVEGELSLTAELEPIIAFTGAAGGSSEAGEGIIEQSESLRVLLRRFCGPLLMRQSKLAPQRHETGGRDLHWVGFTSPVAEEGIFLQVPSRQFIAACVRFAVSGAAMDVVHYNSLGRRWRRGRDQAGPACGGNYAAADEVGDEGYIYGFAQFVDVGQATEGLILSAFSTSPLFDMLRTVVLETLPHLCRAARDAYADCRTAWPAEKQRIIYAVYADVMAPLADLVEPRSKACSTPANNRFCLSFPHARTYVLRPDNLHYPWVNVPLPTLFLSFSYDALRVIHSLLLQERRVVFIGATPQHASACVVSAQAMLSPFLWTLPIVPYLPPEACEVLEALGGAGFILGSTADMVPHLMLRGSLADPQRRSCAGGKAAAVEEEDGGRIWFADGRTGMIGVSPLDTDVVPFTMLDLVPFSEKVKEAMKRVVTKEMRHLFRATLASMATQRRGGASLWSSTLSPCTAAAAVEEVHGAFLEYSVGRLVGNYRKGLTPMSSGIGDVGVGAACSSHLRDSVTFLIDYARFLPCNLDNNANLARRIAGTQMFHHWEDAVLSLETVGVLRLLFGEFAHSQGGSTTSSLHGRETLAIDHYVPHPRMIGLLRLFYARCARRFPDLYGDLQGSDLVRRSASIATGGTPTTTASVTGISSIRTSCPVTGGNGGKKSMRAFFSKATKAVKKSLAPPCNRLPVQVFVQAYGSFANNMGYVKDPNKPVLLNKEFRDNACAAASFTTTQISGSYSTTPSLSGPTVAFDVEDDLYGISSNVFGAYIEDRDTLRRLSTSVGPTAPTVQCRRLPFDVIHQFARYHTLLDPRKDSMCTTGRRAGTMAGSSVEELRRFLEFGPLFAADLSIWPVLESKRLALLSMPVPLPEQPPQQQPFLPSTNGGDANPGEVPFQALPLPFSMDLVTRPVVLPPLPDTVAFHERPDDGTATMYNQPEAQSCQKYAAAVAGGGNVMDDLFAFAAPGSQSSGMTNVPTRLEDFFQ